MKILKIKNLGIYIAFFTTILCKAEQYITIDKRGVKYKFEIDNQAIDFSDLFVLQRFSNWENETFDVFEKVKDPNGIAIDLGAWIGTTAIWLSKNFYHVIAVDADYVSVQRLKKNLIASECENVSICDKPIASKPQRVIFGARGNTLNYSMSYIKDRPDDAADYIVESITLRQLINDYIVNNNQLSSHNISLIKCDIEGGEEDILDDVLQFAYENNSKVYMSFHLDWWKFKKIDDFKSIFKLFKTDCPSEDICKYIKANPFASILFVPISK